MSDGQNGSVLGGKYQLQRIIKRGGMGTVCEVIKIGSKQRLAAKILHPQLARSSESVKRFELEALAAAAIGHENIVDVLDMGRSPDGSPYLIMEYLDGMSLDDVLKQEFSLEIDRAVEISIQVLAALRAAHKKNIIHRDLKPANIFLCRRPGQPELAKLLDFGISKFIASDMEVSTRLTHAGIILGTPWYMSPEQARGDPRISPAADIYSMGVVMYEALTGSLPFDAESYTALLIKISTTPPPDPRTHNPALPSELAQAILTAMARDPKDRFASCQDFSRSLLPFTETRTPSSAESPTRRRIRRKRGADVGPGDTPVEVPSPVRNKPAIRKAVFVGLGRSSDQISLERGGWLHVISSADIPGALIAIEDCTPNLVVANSLVQHGQDEELLQSMRNRIPTFRAPLILMDLDSSSPGLVIYEWSVACGDYAKRMAQLEQLGQEIELLCVRDIATFSKTAELHEIGYYDAIDCQGYSVHVQTEVMVTDEIKIKTTILKNGAVTGVDVQTCRSSDEHAVRETTNAAQQQHNAALAQVQHSLPG